MTIHFHVGRVPFTFHLGISANCPAQRSRHESLDDPGEHDYH
jgi:hypothetical protein